MILCCCILFWKPLPSDARKPISEKAQAKKCPRWPQCHKWHCHHRGHLFYILVPDGQNRYSQFLFYHYHIAENATGCRTRQFAPVLGFFYFPAFKPTCLTFPHRAMAGKPVFRQCTAGGTPATASHAHMTITVAGLPSRWQESGAFPFVVAPPFIYPRSALRHSIRSIFLFATPCMPTFPCRLQDGISMSFSLLGQR